MFLYFLLAAAGVVLGTLFSPPTFTLVLLLLVALMLASALLPAFKNKAHGYRWLLVILAFSYGFGWLQWQLNQRLPIELDKHEATLELLVVESTQEESRQRLLVKVQSIEQDTATQSLASLRRLNVSYYRFHPEIKAGALIKARVVLRSPRNIANGLAFDYEAWLMAKGIDATGYIKEVDLLHQGDLPWRQQLIEHQRIRISTAAWPWVAGLVFGEQEAFTPEQWQLAKQTGTLHLLVVSGLHMGLVLLLLVFSWRLVLKGLSFTLGRTPPYLVFLQLGFLLVGSAGYLWLAGSGVALQRAWLMFALVLVLQGTRLKLNWMTAIAFALLLVVLINPLIWTGPGFSYSFVAVLALLLFFSARKSNWLEALWLPQWVVFVALLPLFISWQQPVSLLQWWANLVAIPLVSLLLLPLALLNVLVPYAPLAELLSLVGDAFWWWLEQASVIPLSYALSLPWLSLLLWPVAMLLIRRGVSYLFALTVSVVIVAAVFLSSNSHQPVAMMMDVGQGQSLVFTTPKHSLVYDAGPFMGSFDTGEAVISPVLYRLGVRQIDHLIISHNDNDHAGGTGALLRNFHVLQWSGGQVVKNLPEDLPETIYLCRHSTTHWQVLSNNLLYRYLSVDENAWQRLPDNNNNRSCVVQLEWYGTRFLLTGDIDKAVEYDLIRKYEQSLKSDILVLAHHGSRSSTSEVFLRTVAPKTVWISAGFNNAFQHPATDVLERIEQQGVPWLNTAEEGAIILQPNGETESIRQGWQPPWRQP